jgi:cytochrome c oxidase subunit 3
MALASISMLFLGLTSAYVVRQGADTGWRGIAMPPLLAANTVVLLASSAALELARRATRRGPAGERVFRRWVWTALLLGVLFLAGQLAVWRQLAALGIYLDTHPHGAFYYTLSGLHGLHLAGGIAALGWLALRVWRDPAVSGRWFEVTALYWHFMDGLWVYLLVLLFGLTQ